MRKTMIVAMLAALTFGSAPAAAGSAKTPGVSDLSAQSHRPPARLRVYPGRLLYRDCTFRLAQEWRPSGTVIVPRQHCWWVRG
jgi:hypothetical protein